MKISEGELTRLIALSNAERAHTSRSGSTRVAEAPGDRYGSSSDSVNFSASSQEIQRIKSYIHSLPDVRAARVAELKTQIDNGTYHVSGAEIADLMIRRVLADNTSL